MTKYRPEIDGLRAIAVIAVIIFHLNSSFLIGGYYGVDVFFVISGYLITGILVKKISEENFRMWDFWMRRVKRLIPLLLVVIITTTVALPILVFRPTVNGLVNDITPAIFSYYNFHAYFNFGDYWGPAADKSFFLHTWSLSVEEQFYLFYPFTLILIHKYFKNFLIPLVFITTFSLGLFLYFITTKTQLVFYMLPFRIWELSIGGIIACLPLKEYSSKKSAFIFPVIGISLILVSYFFSYSTMSWMAILPVLGSFFIIYFGSNTVFFGKLLGSKIFVHIGKLSYSLYLWHWPIIVLYRNLEIKFIYANKFLLYLIIILITYSLSYFTHNHIETRFRNFKETPKLVLVGIAICMGMLIFFKSAYFNIYYKPLYKQQTVYSLYYDVTPTQEIIEKDNPRLYDVIFQPRLDYNMYAYKKQGIVQIVNNKDPEVLILGDSHGTIWAKTIIEAANELKVSTSVYTTNGSLPFFNFKDLDDQTSSTFFTKEERIDFAKSIVRNIEIWKIRLVVMSCRWENLSPKDKMDFERLTEYLRVKDIQLLLINQPPHLSFIGDNNALQFISYLKIKPVINYNTIALNQDKIILSNSYLNELAKNNNNVTVIDVFGGMYQHGRAKITFNDEVLYFDDDHLSITGTTLFKEGIKKAIDKCLNKSFRH